MTEKDPDPRAGGGDDEKEKETDPDLKTQRKPDLGDENTQTQQRVRVISNAREKVSETKQEAIRARLNGQLTRTEQNTMIRSALEDYLMELEYLLKDDDTPGGYWDTEHIGTVQFRVPQTLLDRTSVEQDYTIIPGEYATQEFVGLESIVEAPEVLTQQFEVNIKTLPESHNPNPELVRKQIPKHILMDAFRLANDFVGEVGLDVQFTKGAPKWGFEEVSDNE